MRSRGQEFPVPVRKGARVLFLKLYAEEKKVTGNFKAGGYWQEDKLAQVS